LVVVIEVPFVAQARDAEGLVLVPIGQVEESGRRGRVSCKRVEGSFAQLIRVGVFGDIVVFEEALGSAVANPVLAEVESGLPGVGVAVAAPGLLVVIGVGEGGPDPPLGSFGVIRGGGFVVSLYYWVVLGGSRVLLGGGCSIGVHSTVDFRGDDVLRGELALVERKRV
jgi:hypothetical protein